MKSELIYRASGRKHPYKEGIKYNPAIWGFKNIETGNVFDTIEEADQDKKPVKRVARKKATVKK